MTCAGTHVCMGGSMQSLVIRVVGCRFQIHVMVLGFEMNDVEACEIGFILGDTLSSKLRG
jgi:hypothetical protein